MKVYLIFVRFTFCVFSKLSPTLAGKVAFRLFQRPMYSVIRPTERSFYETAKHFRLDHFPEDIDCYEIGNQEGELVFLVHGWESHAGSMAAIASALANQGYRVISFNLPAHGHSKLKRANILTCSNALDRVFRYYRFSGPISVISHSFGSAVTTYTLARYGHRVDRFIMLSTPDKILDIFYSFKKTISLGNHAFQVMLKEVQSLLGEDLESVAINKLTGRANYRSLNIIHDQYDKVLPYSNSLNVYRQAQKATLTTMEKVGHYRMLWNHSVIRTILFDLGTNRENAA